MHLKSGCFALTASLILTGCGPFLDQRGEDTFARFSSESDLIDNYSFNLTFTDGNTSRTYSNPDFIETGGSILGVGTRRVKVASSGELAVTFSVSADNGGPNIAEGEYRLKLGEGRSYVSHFLTDSLETDPVRNCADCAGYYAFEIDTAALQPDSELRDDSLYVLWAVASVN